MSVTIFRMILIMIGVMILALLGRCVYSIAGGVRYDLAVSATMSVNGKKYTQVQPYHCQVQDYSWLMTAEPFAAQSGEPIYFVHDNGAVAITGFHACEWTDGPPAAGVVYKLLAALDRLGPNEIEDDSTELPAGGVEVVTIEDINRLGRVRVYDLDDVERGLAPGLQIHSLTVTAGSPPAPPPASVAIPYLDGKTPRHLFWVHAEVSKVSRDRCNIPAGRKWVVIESAADCGSNDSQPTGVKIAASAQRVDVRADGRGAVELISKAELVQLGVGHPYEGKEPAWRDRYVWPVNVCVEGTCVTIEGGSPTKKNYVSLVDVAGGRYVSVFVGHSVTPRTINSLIP